MNAKPSASATSDALRKPLGVYSAGLIVAVCLFSRPPIQAQEQGQQLNVADLLPDYAKAYDALKLIEAKFPFPTNRELMVGTFQPSMNCFIPVSSFKDNISSVVSDAPNTKLRFFFNGLMGGPDLLVLATYERHLRTFAYGSGSPIPQKWDGSWVTVEVGTADMVDWRASALVGNMKRVEYTGRTLIRHDSNAVVCGAFTMPVLPVALIYCPPGDGRVSYTSTRGSGATLTTTFADEQSTTTSGTPGDYYGLGDLKKGIEGFQKVASLTPALGDTLKNVLGILNKGLGSASASDAQGTTSSGTHNLCTSFWSSETAYTPAGGLSGSQDIVWYLFDAKVAWAACPDENGRVKKFLTVLGGTPIHCTVQLLKDDLADLEKLHPPGAPNESVTPEIPAVAEGDPEFPSTPKAGGGQPRTPPRGEPSRRDPVRVPATGPTNVQSRPKARLGTAVSGRVPHQPPVLARGSRTGLSLPALKALLDLDPFVAAGPDAELDPGRFVKVGPPRGYEGHLEEAEWGYTYEKTSVTGRASFKGHIEQYSSGFLGTFGFGVAADKTIANRSSIGQSVGRKIGQSVTTRLSIDAPVGKIEAIQAYIDLAFGTFAFQRVPLIPTDAWDVLGGAMRGPGGQPLANTWVTLTIGQQRWMARTDAQGHYRFRFRDIPRGKSGFAQAGSVRQSVVIPREQPR